MRAFFSIASLLIVLGVILVAVKHQLRASQAYLPSRNAPAAAAASEPFGGASQPSVAQFQRELDRTLKEGAAARAAATEAAEASR